VALEHLIPDFFARCRSTAAALEAVLAGLPGLVVHGIDGMADQRHAWLERDRLVQASLSGAAAMALALGAVGLFGMLAFSVSRRARELATRVVLGATPRDLVLLMLREHVGRVAAATAGAFVGAVAVNLAISEVLAEVHAFEPLVIAAAAALPNVCLLGAAGLAGRRCGRHDPATLLRVE
jgi:predicted lysophospholipase L1 biosynthesis ABC-type transport system permease subunit